VKKNLLFWLMFVGFWVSAICASQSMAAEFHVTNATEFRDTLNTTEINGEDDVIYLAAGTYTGSFGYHPAETEHKSLTIAGEPGTNSSQIILDGQNLKGVLTFYDDTSAGPIADITVRGITIQKGLGSGGASGLRMRFLGGGNKNISIVDCIIKENSGPGYGAGIVIEADGAGNVLLENNLIINNITTERDDTDCKGGGVAILYSGTGEVTVRNNIIANNSASGITAPQGGGLWIQEGIVHLIGNTIYNNQANQGGGVYFDSANAANVYNNIIYENTATEGGDIYFENATNRIGHNNNYSNMYGTWTVSENNLNAEPLFVSPKNNDFHLRPNSPMVNAGKSDVPSPPGLPVTDFEGDPRSYGEAPDMGADEYAGDKHYPEEGTFGTQIAFLGSGFGDKKGKVLVGTSALKVLEWTQETIRCQLAKVLSLGTYDVTIQPKTADQIVIDDGFTVKAPEIRSIGPTGGSAGDEMTIYGSFFGTKKGKVTLGGKSCRVLRWRMDPTTGASEIDFVVPKRLTPGVNELKIINGMGSDTVDFTVE